MKKTDWYPGHVKPVRVGVYECEWSFHGVKSYYYNCWDGINWCYGYESYKHFMILDSKPIDSEHILVSWRGVKK